jgi:hypothetical protein
LWLLARIGTEIQEQQKQEQLQIRGSFTAFRMTAENEQRHEHCTCNDNGNCSGNDNGNCSGNCKYGILRFALG